MKSLHVFVLLVLCVALASTTAYTKDVGKFAPEPVSKSSFHNTVPDLGVPVAVPRAAQAGTTYLGYWTFDSGPNCVEEGWTHVDLTEQLGDFWHVENFDGLPGLSPIEGNQSMWCGARPDPGSLILCGYANLPGYGNGWDQAICSRTCLTVTSGVEIHFSTRYNSEANWDATTLEVDQCDGDWYDLYGGVGVWDGAGSDTLTIAVPDSLHSGSLGFRFHFQADGAYSDEDFGDFDGVWIDELSVTDDGGTVVAYEDFEDEAVGSNDADDWVTCTPPGYGDFASLFPGVTTLQEDPCRSDLDCVWAFFSGSTYNYACGGFPATPAVPFVNSRDQYLFNEIWSPQIPWTGTGATVELRFWVYRDLPRDNLIRYVWHVRSIVDGCPGAWRDENFVYYGPRGKDWLNELFSIGDKIEPTASHVQIALGAWDMCPYWCGSVGTGACHSHAPLIDDVRLYRVATLGPQWIVRNIDLFQDNFATDGSTTGTVRADMARDIQASTNPAILPGDSAVVTVSDPEAGVASDAYTGFGPAVYAYVRVDPPQPSKSGEALTQDAFRWPVVDSLVTSDGNRWYIVRMDTAFSLAGRGSPAPDRYCVDLNDNLFTPGDTLWFFFAAKSADVAGSWTYYFNQYNHLDNTDGVTAIKQTLYLEEAAANAEEMTCLPAAGLDAGNDILYVDDMSGRGGQPYFDTAFQQMGLLNRVDRFDVRGPSSTIANGLGSRVTDASRQIIPIYRKIIWNSGNLYTGLIGDGVAAGEKSDDFSLLFNFIDQSDRVPGLWVVGNYNATEWASLSTPAALGLRSTYMNFDVITVDHKQLGLPISPLVVGASGGAFDNATGPDTLVAYGGCPLLKEFDVLEQSGLSTVQAYYDGDMSYPAILSQQTTNSQGVTASVMLSGFSYHYVRNDRPQPIMDRMEHLRKVLLFLGNTPQTPTGVDPTGYQYSLSQNYPNPFNPTTTIKYTLKERTQVSLRIYNVAGQLTRTLVNEVKSPGEVHAATWDGRNDAGQSVSSGVYFYKLVAGDYVQTKKMVLLK
jgi:hypothetical protein